MPHSKPLQERFWEKVTIASPDECWEWNGAKLKAGYGFFRIDSHRNITAHKMSYMLANGDISYGLLVCHKCDNPSCVNPSHLFLGTSKENSQDMTSKNRQVRGEKASHPKKLSVDEVQEIRVADWTHREIAKVYGVNQSTVTRIKNNKRWAWLPK